MRDRDMFYYIAYVCVCSVPMSVFILACIGAHTCIRPDISVGCPFLLKDSVFY